MDMSSSNQTISLCANNCFYKSTIFFVQINLGYSNGGYICLSTDIKVQSKLPTTISSEKRCTI